MARTFLSEGDRQTKKDAEKKRKKYEFRCKTVNCQKESERKMDIELKQEETDRITKGSETERQASQTDGQLGTVCQTPDRHRQKLAEKNEMKVKK